MKKVDFICIGAPKSATSTLFELIEGHPDIYVPPAKEVPFFNDDELFEKGWKWYMQTFFKDAQKNQVIGTMTPQYMSGNGFNTSEKIADRIHRQLPKVKIIALLRHPIERSFSQHKMHNRYGYISDSFDDSVNSLLKKDLDKEHREINHTNMFLFASEYGRILSHYYSLFPSENILVLYTDDFEKNPKDTLRTLFSFLNVNSTYVPDDVGRRSHVGSGKAKIAFLTPGFLKKHPFLNSLWRNLVPIKLRKKLFMWITRWNIKKDDTRLDNQGRAYKQLKQYFKEDVELLENVSQTTTPWDEWS